MEDLDFLLNYSEDLKIEISALPFHRDDIRTVYFAYYFDLIYNLYISKSMFELSSNISRKQIALTKELLEEGEQHIKRLVEMSEFEILNKSFNHNINRSFFFDAYSSFEVCMNVLCEAIISAEETEYILKHNLNEVRQILKGVELTETIQTKLNKLLTKNHLTHVPFARKVELLFKYSRKNYPRNIKNDREFFVFLSKLRNTIHTQWIYFGNNYDYSFNDDIHFTFQNGKVVIWTNPYNDGGAMLFVDIFDQLKEIWRAFILNIPFENQISIYDENI